MTQHIPVAARKEGHQIPLDLGRFVGFGKTEPLCDPADVRVDDNSFRRGERNPEHNISGLSAHPRQRHEFIEGPRDFASVIFYEELRERDNILRLLAKHADAIQTSLDRVLISEGEFVSCRIARKERGGDAVDLNVYGLRAEHGCDEELEGALVV